MDDRILIDYTVRDAAFTFLDGAPPVTGVNGQGHSTGRATRFAATSGAMESAPGKKLDLSDVVFSMPDLRPSPCR